MSIMIDEPELSQPVEVWEAFLADLKTLPQDDGMVRLCLTDAKYVIEYLREQAALPDAA
jgi:hypothetical protein